MFMMIVECGVGMDQVNQPELGKIYNLFFALTCDGLWDIDISEPKLQRVAFLIYVVLRSVEGHCPYIISNPEESKPNHAGHLIRQGIFLPTCLTCTPLPKDSDCHSASEVSGGLHMVLHGQKGGIFLLIPRA